MSNKSIKWVNNKSINHEIVNSLLQKCIIANHFANFGPNTSILENEIKNKLKINPEKEIIAVVNAACGINALIAALCLYHNRKLKFAVQNFTFPCSAQGLLSDSLIIDLDENMNISLEMLEKNKDEYDGMLITNCFGSCTDIDIYTNFCHKNNKILLFDNAASPYTIYHGSNINNYGDGCVVSFHHTKPIGFGEGGCIIVDHYLKDFVRKIINFGYTPADRYNYSMYASNYKISEISAIYIIQWLTNFDKILMHHTKLLNYFREQIYQKKIPVKLFNSYHDTTEPHLFSTIPIIFEHEIGLDYFTKNSIDAKKYYYPLKIGNNKSVSKYLFDHIICLPLTLDMDETDIDNLINIIDKVHK
ncbi:MAG: aminotransferase [Satyrvirus sp.]|uniref:Aminotransferase n=1 Tax=Satyrvirus sp. TaxID=2487771 RepID=A0A3G5AEX1_9VIRU|nr:MAG: aminotransferase [Satyrvirus sp.]